MSSFPFALHRSHHRIESLTLERSLLFNDFHLVFAAGLTVLFGGRGTGKSALLAIIRFVLDATILPHYRADRDAHVRATLGGGKAILVLVTMYGVRYRVERRWGEAAKVYAEDGSLVDVSLNGPLFKVELYGQRVIEEIGRDDAAKRALIDKFAEAETARLEGELARARTMLAENDDAQRRLKERIEEDEAGTFEIPAIEGALAGLDAAEAERAGERKRERRAIAEVGRAVEGARVEIERAAQGAVRRIGTAIEGAIEEGPAGGTFQAAHAAARGASGAIDGAWGKLAVDLAAFEGAITVAARELVAAHDAEDEAYHAFLARSDASRARAAERQGLHLRLEELSARKWRVDEHQRALGECEALRARLLKEQQRLIAAVRACRAATQAQLNEALAGAVKVAIDDAKDTSAYKALVTDMLKKSGTRPDIDAIVEAFRPAHLAALVRANDAAALEEIDRSKTDVARRRVRGVSAAG